MNFGGWLRTPGHARDLDLDVVRGIAILLAMGWHLNGPPTGSPILDLLLAPGRAFGWAGVDLFFVLSGFLVGRLVLKEHARSGEFDRRRFMVRRALKLWPVLYLFLAAQVVLGDKSWTTFLFQNAFHVQNFTGSSLEHLWSLAVEEHFYLLLALLFPVFMRRNGSPRALLLVLGGILFGSAALRVIGYLASAGPVTLQIQTQFRVDALAAGVALAVLSVHYSAMFERMLRLRLLWAVLTAGGVAFLVLVGKTSGLGVTAGFTVSYLTAAAFLLLLHRSRFVSWARPALRPVGMLGVYSYSLYIWHIAAAKMLRLAAPHLGGALDHPAVMMTAKYVFAIVLAIAITRLLEWPFLRLRDRLFPSHTAAVRETVPSARDSA